jgi:DMSO/TMAO reductase YedYZ heme-binding membrane subunit
MMGAKYRVVGDGRILAKPQIDQLLQAKLSPLAWSHFPGNCLAQPDPSYSFRGNFNDNLFKFDLFTLLEHFMTTMTDTNKQTGQWDNALTFIFSLVLGLAGGLILLATGWLLVNTPVGTTLVSALAITEKTPWYFTRSAGTVAYLLLASSTIWGLLLSTKLLKEMVPAALALAMHNILSWLAVLLTGLHALALLWDSFYTYTLADLTIPFIGPYRPGWVGLGIIGFYLMFLTSLSFNLRKRIGQKRWRQLHYATFAVYILGTVHGVMAGTDSSNVGMQLLYWGSGLTVLFLTNYRILMSQGKPARA